MKNKIISLLLVLIIIFITIGCKKKDNLVNQEENTSIVISERKQNIIDILKNKMKDNDYIDEDNLE